MCPAPPPPPPSKKKHPPVLRPSVLPCSCGPEQASLCQAPRWGLRFLPIELNNFPV